MAERYNTNNPRPSNSMKDLNDNALAYDDFINSDADTALDRFNNPFPTVRKQVDGRIDELVGASQNAIESAEIATAAAENVLLLSHLYTSVAEAQADITDGTIPLNAMLNVAVPAGAVPPRFADQYQNVAGVATPTGVSYPSSEYVDTLWGVDTVQALVLDPWTGYLFGVTGDGGKFPFAIKIDGTVVQPAIKTENIDVSNVNIQYLDPWSGYVMAVLDSNSKSPWAISDKGVVVQPTIETSNIGIGRMEIQQLDPWSGYVMAAVGDQGKSPWAIKNDGTVIQSVIETNTINGLGFKTLDPWSGLQVAFAGRGDKAPWAIRDNGSVVQPSIEVENINGKKYLPYELPTMCIPKATQEWWISPLHTKLYQPYERIVSGAYGEAGQIYACETCPGIGTNKIVQVGKTPGIDDHNTPALWIESGRRPVIAWTRHGADNIIRMRVGDQSGNIDSFLLGDEIAVDIGAAATYTQFHKIKHLSTDSVDILWVFTRWGFVNWGYKQISINQSTGEVDVSAPFVNLFVKAGQLYISTADAYGDGNQIIRVTVCENPATVNSEVQYFELDCVTGGITTPLEPSFSANTNTSGTIPIVVSNVTPLLPSMGDNSYGRRMFYARPGPMSPGLLYAEWSRSAPDEAIYKSIVLINGAWVIREHGMAGPRVGFTPDANYIPGMSWPTPCYSDVLYSAHYDKALNKGVLKEQYVKNDGAIISRVICEADGNHISRPMLPVNGAPELTYSLITAYSATAFTFSASILTSIIQGELK